MVKLSAFVLVSFVLLFNSSAVNAFEFPSSGFFNFPFPTIKPLPSKTPSPTSSPEPTATSTPTPTPNPSTELEILDVDPSSANFMQEFVLYGTNFGNNTGSVSFRASGQNYSSGGAPIVSWSNDEIHAKVPAVRRGTYYIQVITSENKKTNEIKFSVKNGQPMVVSNSLSAVNGTYELVFQETEFGTRRGSIDIYTGNNLAGNGIIKSWTSSRIRFMVPTLPHQEYGFQITTSDGRKSSLKYFTVGN